MPPLGSTAGRVARAQRSGHLVLRARLDSRRTEIESAALARAVGIADPGEVADPAYAAGLRVAVGAAVAFGIDATETGGGDLSIPVELLAQARMAARHGVDLATVLRRYFAGYAILEEFAAAELAGTGLSRDAVQRAFRARAVAFDRLIGAVSRDYRRERDEIPDPVDGRRVESVGRLLAGELLDAPELNYDLSVRHLGLVAAGASVDEPLRHLARGLDCRVLLVRPDGDTTWAWLGARRPIEAGAALSALLDARKEEVTIALGEPGGGLDGWRLTHLQAKAALPVALRTGKPLVRYADVALVAAAQRNELLTASLFRLYLKPLDDGKGRGATLRATLRAYLAAGCNASSAASALGTRRQTVARRLREIESKLGRPIDGCLGELDLALRLEAQVGPPVDAQGHGVCAI